MLGTLLCHLGSSLEFPASLANSTYDFDVIHCHVAQPSLPSFALKYNLPVYQQNKLLNVFQ